MAVETRSQRLERWMVDYGTAILRTCFVSLADAALAEDATQDTFLKAWMAMDRFEGRNGCSERTWLVSIALNTCRDYRRSAWLRHVDLKRALEDIPPAYVSIAHDDRTLFLEIMGLPVKYRQALLLHSYHGLTVREAAQALHVSASTAHHRLKKAQALLRRAMEGGDMHD